METDQPAYFHPMPAQKLFLECEADVALFGGGAGPGKTTALLLEHFYDVDKPGFRSVVFRRTTPMLRQPGGLWDASSEIFRPAGAVANETRLTWTFPSGSVIQFSHMETVQDREGWAGAQIPLICFDQVEEFESEQWWFMFSRNRSLSGAKCRIRATCNPVSDGWLRAFLDWWIGPDGFPVKERAGKWRWFIRDGDGLVWADTKAELLDKFGAECGPKSVAFFPALVTDNRILMQRDPGYVSNLRALPSVDRQRLLFGDWNARPTAGSYFKRSDFAVVDALPAGRRVVRSWDRASTEKTPSNSPDWTRGLKVSRDASGVFYVEDMQSAQARPSDVENLIVATASQDGREVEILLQHDPGSAGTAEVEFTVRALAGYTVFAERNSTSKEARAGGASTQAGAGNIKIVRGGWNEAFLAELSNFPVGKNDDIVDSLSAAINRLAERGGGCINAEDIPEMKRLNAPGPQTGRHWQSRFPPGWSGRRFF